MPANPAKPLSLNLSLINKLDDDNQGQQLGLTDEADEDIFRHEGLSIGRNYVRLEGSTLYKDDNLWLPENLVMEHTVGKGSCSRVVKALYASPNSKSPKAVALKQFGLAEHPDELVKELKALAQMDCECLVQLMGAFLEPTTVTLVLEYMDAGSLDKLLIKSDSIPFKVAAAMSYQMLWGLAYLHHEQYTHRDVKPGNVLLHTDGSVKLSDFGISSCSVMNTTVVGTTLYMALERLTRRPYGPPADVWSCGLVIHQILTGKFLFEHLNSVVELVVTLQDEEFSASIDKDEEALQVVQGCLQTDPSKRMPAQVLLQAPWFQEFNDVPAAKEIVKKFLADTVV
jgi:serine/threonine protein kinase